MTEVGPAEILLPTIRAVKEAVAGGEFNKPLMVAKKEGGRPKRKAVR